MRGRERGGQRTRLQRGSLSRKGRELLTAEDKALLYCEVCHTQLNSVKAAAMHMRGSKHRRKKRETIGDNEPDKLHWCLEKLSTVKGGADLEEGRFRCELCDVNFLHGAMNESLYRLHILGKKHQKKLPLDERSSKEEIEEAKTKMAKQKNKQESSQKDDFYCDACDAKMNSQLRYDEHMAGKKHRSQIEANQSAENRARELADANRVLMELPEYNRGAKLLKIMGYDYSSGQGLGKHGQGRRAPIPTQFKCDTKGLGLLRAVLRQKKEATFSHASTSRLDTTFTRSVGNPTLLEPDQAEVAVSKGEAVSMTCRGRKRADKCT